MGAMAFNEGHRYVDFDAKRDKVAGYGLGALIIGGIGATAGLFKGLIALLIASKKLVIVGGLAVVAAVKQFFGGKKVSASDEP